MNAPIEANQGTIIRRETVAARGKWSARSCLEWMPTLQIKRAARENRAAHCCFR
jgi:hypothetical protein